MAGGGGLFISEEGKASIRNSTFSNNQATGGGGGIRNVRGDLELRNSTISGNSGGEIGGGIFNTVGSKASVINSTVNENIAGSGGGFYNGGEIDIANSTVVNNSALGNVGGGIYNYDGTTSLFSSIVANNTAVNSNPDLLNLGGTLSASFSLIESDADQINGSQSNNITGQDPLLDPAGLQDNGGLTQTIAILPDSLAIDAGSNPEGLEFDQRGAGFPREVNGQADIGAFELTDLLVGLYDADSNVLIDIIEDDGRNPGKLHFQPGQSHHCSIRSRRQPVFSTKSGACSSTSTMERRPAPKM